MAASGRRFVALAHQACVETLRSPVFALVLVASLAVSGWLTGLDYLSFLDQRRLVADSQLAVLAAAGVFAAAVGASGVIGDELRRRTVRLVLTRPIGRDTWLLARFAGLAVALTCLWLPHATAVLWGSRIAFADYHPDRLALSAYAVTLVAGVALAAGANHRWGWSLPATCVTLLAVGFPLVFAALAPRGWWLVDWRLLPVVALAWPALLLTAAVAGAAACRLEWVPTLLVTGAVLLVGLLAGPLARWWPCWQPFWIVDARPATVVAWSSVARAMADGGLQSAGVLALASALLARRELG